MVIGRGNGKLLLFGEHAAVYGYPSLGMQLPRFLGVGLESVGGTGWDLPGMDERSVGLISRAVEALPPIIGYAVEPHRMTISGSLPMSVGFGSSAAFCTALLRAVSPDRYDDSSIAVLWKDAHALERVFHGTPSGIDTGLSLLPGTSLMIARPPDVPDARPARLPDGWLVVGAIPRTGSTADLVGGLRRKRDANPKDIEGKLKRLGALAEAATQLNSPGALVDFGRLVREAHQTLADLGLSTPAMEDALGLLYGAGSLGCKLSGAGGGGAFFGVFPERDSAEAAERNLNEWLGDHHPLPEGPFSLVMSLGEET